MKHVLLSLVCFLALTTSTQATTQDEKAQLMYTLDFTSESIALDIATNFYGSARLLDVNGNVVQSVIKTAKNKLEWILLAEHHNMYYLQFMDKAGEVYREELILL